MPQELSGGSFGTFGKTKGARFLTPSGKDGGVRENKEVLVSYGPKTPADYLSKHAFLPDRAVCAASCCPSVADNLTSRRLCEVVKTSFALSEDDRFLDHKTDVLDFHAELFSPTQSSDLISADNPNPALLRFLRLAELRAAKAFLLKVVLRQDVCDFMACPVSQTNKEAVLKHTATVCWDTLKDVENDDKNHDEEKETLLLVKKSDRLDPHDLLPA